MSRDLLERYAALLGAWPGLVSGPPGPLVDDCLVLLDHLNFFPRCDPAQNFSPLLRHLLHTGSFHVSNMSCNGG